MWKPNAAPTIHVIGNITADIIWPDMVDMYSPWKQYANPDFYAQGGPVSYVSVALKRLGFNEVHAYSRGPVGGPLPYFQKLRDNGVIAHSLSPKDDRFTEFVNLVDANLNREQYCPYASEPITISHFKKQRIPLPENGVVVMVPVMDEIPRETLHELMNRGNTLVTVPSGLIRQRDPSSFRVRPRRSIELPALASLFSLGIFSDEDVFQWSTEYLIPFRSSFGAAIQTHGEGGSTVYRKEKLVGVKFDAYPLPHGDAKRLREANEITRSMATTGLGDVFSAGVIAGLYGSRHEDAETQWKNAIKWASFVATAKIRLALRLQRAGIDGAPYTHELQMLLNVESARQDQLQEQWGGRWKEHW